MQNRFLDKSASPRASSLVWWGAPGQLNLSPSSLPCLASSTYTSDQRRLAPTDLSYRMLHRQTNPSKLARCHFETSVFTYLIGSCGTCVFRRCCRRWSGGQSAEYRTPLDGLPLCRCPTGHPFLSLFRGRASERFNRWVATETDCASRLQL